MKWSLLSLMAVAAFPIFVGGQTVANEPQATDWLSGTYTIFLSDEERKQLDELHEEDRAGVLTPIVLTPIEGGWVLVQGEDSVDLEERGGEPNFYEDFFPGLEDEGLQCGVSTRTIFCHVTPETVIEEEGEPPILARTGYFIIQLHVGMFELERVE